jgi:hypothetical protein
MQPLLAYVSTLYLHSPLRLLGNLITTQERLSLYIFPIINQEPGLRLSKCLVRVCMIDQTKSAASKKSVRPIQGMALEEASKAPVLVKSAGYAASIRCSSRTVDTSYVNYSRN